MPIIYLKEEPAYKLGVWRIEETAEELQNMLQLNEEELEFLASLNNNKRYLHWLSSRVMLRKLLNTTEFIDIDVKKTGKPVLKNFPHHVSFSHSHEMAAVIISETVDVGIDIEHIHPKVQRIQHKFLSEHELENVEGPNSVEHLIQSWCAKEALFKYYGKGNVDFKQHLRIKNYSYKESGRMEAFILKEDCNSEFIVHHEKVDHYILAYVAGEYEED